jgi:hypothetical protein
MKDKSELKLEGRIAFYASLFNDFKVSAADVGYTLTVHGSLARDMDLIAIPWTEDAVDAETLVKVISETMGPTVYKKHHIKTQTLKPHGRLVYTLSFYSDWFIDLSIMPKMS